MGKGSTNGASFERSRVSAGLKVEVRARGAASRLRAPLRRKWRRVGRKQRGISLDCSLNNRSGEGRPGPAAVAGPEAELFGRFAGARAQQVGDAVGAVAGEVEHVV